MASIQQTTKRKNNIPTTPPDSLIIFATARGATARTLRGSDRWQAYKMFKSELEARLPVNAPNAWRDAAVDTYIEEAAI